MSDNGRKYISALTGWLGMGLMLLTTALVVTALLWRTQPVESNAVSTAFSPTRVSLPLIGNNATITLATVGIDAGADAVQINIQHTGGVSITSPACVGIFNGGTALPPVAVEGGTLIGCFLGPGKNVSATTGNIMTFGVTRLGNGQFTLSFGLTGAFATQFSDAGNSILPGKTNTLQITPESANVAESVRKDASFSRSDVARVEERPFFALGVELPAGWSTFSIPISAQDSSFFTTSPRRVDRAPDGLVDPKEVEVAFRFNAASQMFEQIVGGNKLSPTEAVLVKSRGTHRPFLFINQGQTNPPSRLLSAGWNLVGLAAPLDTVSMPVDQALISVQENPQGLVGYTQVLSPSINPEAFVWIRGQDQPPRLARWRGYWVFMRNAGPLAGFSTTPVQP